MILDLFQLKKCGKVSENFFFEYCPNGLELNIPSSEIQNPVKVCGKVTLIGDHSALVEGEIVLTVRGECTRCLEAAENTYSAEFSEACGEEDGYPVVKDKIDLAKIVDDAILLNLPVSFLCKEDCKGLCPHCGKNLVIDYRGAGLQINCSECGESVLVPIPDGMELNDLDLDPGEILKQLFATRRNYQKSELQVQQLKARLVQLQETLGVMQEVVAEGIAAS